MTSSDTETHDIVAILEGRAPAPVMPGDNPFPLWTTHWFAFKEIHYGYVPYHIRCSEMPRVRKVDDVTFECPYCRTRFPTSTSQLSEEVVEIIKAMPARKIQ